MARYAVAIDVGGTKLAVAVIDADGKIRRKLKLATDKSSPQAAVAQIAEAAHRVVSEGEIPWDQVQAAGVAVPGIYFADSGTVWAPNIPGWDRIPLRQELEAKLPVPVVVDSDRAAYVLGEQWLGAAQGCTDVIFVAAGTGIGAGIISGGRLCRGANDIAGAIGWFALNPVKHEIYRQVGCFEAEAAGPGIARRAGAASAEAIVQAARNGDPRARQVIEETARWLGMGIANLVSVLNPQMIVLGGGLINAGDLLLEPVRREMLEWAQPVAAREVRIELTRLGEDAGLFGAARLSLCLHENTTNEPQRF